MQSQLFDALNTQILIKELKFNGIIFSNDKWLNSKSVINEIMTCMMPLQFENKINSIGIIFCNKISDFKSHLIIHVNAHYLLQAHQFVDGIEWFLIYQKSKFIGIIKFNSIYHNEFEFMKQFPLSGGLFIKRNENAETLFFQGNEVITHHNRIWSKRDNLRILEWKICQSVKNINQKNLKNLLNFTNYYLNPSKKTGGIIIWTFKKLNKNEKSIFSKFKNLKKIKISLLNKDHLSIILNLLKNIDGALLFGPNLELLGSSIQIKNSEKSKKIIKEYKGTRHTSSQRLSYDLMYSLIITISEDGPISIFSNGANLTKIEYPALENDRKNQNIKIKTSINKCTVCHKLNIVEKSLSIKKNKKNKVYCPTCKKLFLSSYRYYLKTKPFLNL